MYFLPWNSSNVPGDSSQPANIEPIIHTEPPAARALVISPEYLIPPSATIGIPLFLATSYTSIIADICGTPIPATTRVVQIEPGPIPTLTASAPASIRASAASAVAILPAITCKSGYASFTFRTASIIFLE